MAEKKVGVLVKEARTAAKLTQEKLAQAVGGTLTAADISKCEQGKADLTAAQLKKIAVACGVTQASLVNAPKNLSDSSAAKKTSAAKTSSTAKTGTAKTTSSAKKTASAKTSSSKTSSSKTSSSKTSSSGSTKKKTEAAVPANANVSMKVTSTEQKLIQAYRGSTSDRKKAALKLLNGDYGETIDKILAVTNGTASSSSSSSSSAANGLGDMVNSLLGSLLGGK